MPKHLLSWTWTVPPFKSCRKMNRKAGAPPHVISPPHLSSLEVPNICNRSPKNHRTIQKRIIYKSTIAYSPTPTWFPALSSPGLAFPAQTSPSRILSRNAPPSKVLAIEKPTWNSRWNLKSANGNTCLCHMWKSLYIIYYTCPPNSRHGQDSPPRKTGWCHKEILAQPPMHHMLLCIHLYIAAW